MSSLVSNGLSGRFGSSPIWHRLAINSALLDQVREVDLKTEDKRGLRPLRDSATPIQDIGRGRGAGERPAGTLRTDLPWNN